MSSNSVSISSVRTIIDYLESNSYIDENKKSELLESLDLSEETLNLAEHRVDTERYKALWSAAEEITNNPAIGLHVGDNTKHETASLVSNLLIHCSSYEEGIKQYVKFSEILNTGIKVELKIEGEEALLSFKHQNQDIYCQADAERILAMIAKRARYLSKSEAQINAVFFEHAPPEYVEEYEQLFQCKIQFCAPYTAISFPVENLKMSPQHQNPYVYSSLVEKAKSLKQRIASRRFSKKVEEILNQEIESGPVDIETVSSKLNMNRQTLYRKLKLEGLAFSELVNQVRCTKAMEYLRDKSISLCEIALSLGFSDSSAFSRAFKRWTGQSPNSYRNMVLST